MHSITGHIHTSMLVTVFTVGVAELTLSYLLTYFTYLSVGHCKYSSILYHFQVI